MSPDARRVPGGSRRARPEFARRAGPERAGQGVDEAVNMVERQRVQDAVVRRPAPGGGERGDLGREVAVGGESAPWGAGGAAGVDEEGGGGGVGWGRGCGGMGIGWGPGGGGRRVAGWGQRENGGRPRPRGGREEGGLGEGGVGDDHAGTGVVQHVFEFGEGMGDSERHRNAAPRPDTQLYRHVGAPRRDQVGDSVAGHCRRQSVSPHHGFAQELGEAPLAVFVSHGGSPSQGRVGNPVEQGGRSVRDAGEVHEHCGTAARDPG